MDGIRRVYIGSFTKDAGGEGTGISLAHQDASTGALSLVDVVAQTTSPAFLAWHPDGTHLYAVNERGDASVTAYAVRPDGGLRELSTEPTGGNGACHLTVHPSGRFLLTANYGSGHLSVHPIRPDGSVAERSDLIQHEGSGPRADRQEGPHAHHIRVDPTGGHVLAVDLGLDAVLTYTLDLDDGTLAPGPVAETAPGAGPRHLAFGPDNLVHVAGELDSTVTTYVLDPSTGALTHQGVAPSTLAEAPDDNYPSEIGISDDGRMLYVANRGLDVIGALSVQGGRVTPVADVPTGGAWPRHLVVAGQHLYVANERSHQVTHFVLDAATGVPEQAADVLEIPSPACVLPAPQ
ncbi:6-phosphogluconolactonase, cycloisomerase 2 family [Actinopolymorpha cephalotaxi]|uniref:6-phosphogluconolactonase (Cycloisomerase 2 family) n=1 Tax=Actinopolymorpha cephalotaxi TaxID=504797 RepID=A0A1I2LJZ6_9ACTN|nr:lactonase family protein [Actinopolymorpha cephalotaxi]NYH81323.1 6-phosphogluconolactonase (cycloisomerase 2 family) [Actinopolymorpha cephalotaxi]SFF79595.1 6-phosphogluconolactonase, cycloisomerase 2 family [Actinopolymorpha cephalotaxi]